MVYSLCLSQVKLQLFLDKIIHKTFDLSRIKVLKSAKQLFRTTEKLTKDQVGITGLSTTDWNQPMWIESSLLCDRAVRIMKSKPYVFADSVVCLGSLSDKPVEAWKDKIKCFWDHAV